MEGWADLPITPTTHALGSMQPVLRSRVLLPFYCSRLAVQTERGATSCFNTGRHILVVAAALSCLKGSGVSRTWICRKAVSGQPRPQKKAQGFGSSPVASGTDAKRPKDRKVRAAATTDEELRNFNTMINEAIDRNGDAMVNALRDKGWWASDGPVLPAKYREGLRSEVEALWKEGYFEKSQSVRGSEYYDKNHVYATEIDGGKFEIAPRFAHYTVTATRALAARIAAAFPEMQLSDKYIGNKLNLCVGEGASFDAHLDVGVAEKPYNRRLTLLIYLNSWRPDLGGEICLLGEGATEDQAALDTGMEAAGLPVKLAPTAGRWVAFWSDRMLHRVEPSWAPNGLEDYRASYTIWFCTKEEGGPNSGTPRPGVVPAGGGYETAPSFARF